MNLTISCKPLVRITTSQTLKREGHIKNKKVQEVKDHIGKEEMRTTIACNALARITTRQTIKIEGHIKKKNVQEVKDHIEHQEMNPTIPCNALKEITTPQTIKIEGHNKNKKIQGVKDHIEHQQEVLQLLKDNATLVHNRMKQQAYQHCSERSFDVANWVFFWLHLKRDIYKKKMLAILYALKKWGPYLMGRHFKVKIDNDSLKYSLEQRLSLEKKQKWVTNILGYDFEIIYKKGKQNFVANALSRKDEDVQELFCAISIIQPDWINKARDEWKKDKEVWPLIRKL